MNINDPKDYELILSHVPGAIVVNTAGTVTYLNEQCASYMGVDRESSLGKHILEVFPDSKMIQNMNINEPKIEFYYSFGAGISVHIPVFQNGERVGLLEFDVVQASAVLYELADGYASFLDRELKDLDGEITHQLNKNKYSLNNILGISPAITRLKEDIQNAAKTDSPILIYGETGTGKELVAHAIHGLSRRSKNNFIKINAANLPENLAESELFGYEPGTFTGARKEGKSGKFQLADKGTLFIDEMNQMPLSIQPKLLRVLQEGEVEKLGSEENIPIDTRIIVTTNQDMRELVRLGEFREDLFYRLHVIPIMIPPLRNRKEDIPVLAEHFTEAYGKLMKKPNIVITDKVYDKLSQYDWPGNVRELQNVIERALAFSKDGVLKASDIYIPDANGVILDETLSNPIEDAKHALERKLILQALERSGGNKAKAAEILKISRPLLYQKMDRLGMNTHSKKHP